MRILKCTNCQRTQKEGKFCLDCGHTLKEVVNKEVKFNAIKTKRSADKLKTDIRTWLNRIGVINPDIQIFRTGETASVEYKLDSKEYDFKSMAQSEYRNNLAAIEQFLHHRVLGIECGIETTEQAFKGYEQIGYYPDELTKKTDEELRKELKRYHPDTGTGDKEMWDKLMKERNRREQLKGK